MTERRADNPLRELCYNSLGEYYLAVNPGYRYVPYQQEIIVPSLEGVECGDIERLMIFIHAGSAKTDIGTKAFIPWYLGRNPGKDVILFTHTAPLAKDFGSIIRNRMSTNEKHQRIFSGLKIDTRNHASDFFRTNRGNSFYAFGMDGGASGRRADCILIEDPVRDLNDALSETVQSALYSTYKAVIKDRLRPGGRIIFIMTRWSVRDLAARILEDEGKKWKVLVLPAQTPNPDKCEGCRADKVDGKIPNHECAAPYLWEEHFGRERYDEAKRDVYIWNAKWQQEPAPMLAQAFQQSWLRFYLPQTSPPMLNEEGQIVGQPTDLRKIAKFNTYILVDPALGKSAEHDRTVIIVLAAGPERRVFWVDGIIDRLDPTERINALVRLVRDWKPQQLVYEEYGLVSDSHFLEIRFKEEGIDLPVTSVGRKAIKGMSGGRLKKHDRILQLQPDFRDGRIWFPRSMKRKLLDGSTLDLVKYAIEKEILPYAGEGSVAHDDWLDCMSRLRDPELFMQHVARDDDEEEGLLDHGHSDGGSWEANY